MNTDDFNKLVEEKIEWIRNTLIKKGAEYSRGGDRLSNFKVAAKVLNQTPEQALRGMWIKHVVSILDFVEDISSGKKIVPAVWAEKQGDVMTYMILLEGLLRKSCLILQRLWILCRSQ